MGIDEVLTAPRSPWQNPYCERVIGSIRRECLDHVIILNDRHLKRILSAYFDYYHNCRTHLSLERNSPVPREVEPPSRGDVISIPQVGGLHHRYTRAACPTLRRTSGCVFSACHGVGVCAPRHHRDSIPGIRNQSRRQRAGQSGSKSRPGQNSR